MEERTFFLGYNNGWRHGLDPYEYQWFTYTYTYTYNLYLYLYLYLYTNKA